MWFLFTLAAGFLGKMGYDKLQAERALPPPKDVTPKPPTTVLGLSAPIEDAPRLARGDDPKAVGKVLPSPLPGVTAAAWTKFCRVMLAGARPGDVVGVFGMSPRRLADLGITSAPKKAWSEKDQRMVLVLGDFTKPLTEGRFRTSFLAQYNAFSDSLRAYDDQIRKGELKVPEGMSRSGALALLHRAGPKALEEWTKGRRLKPTVAVVSKANGIF